MDMDMSMTMTSTATSTGAMSSSTSMGGMDMGGMDMGGMGMGGMDMDMGTGSCKVSMLWNWNTIDACKPQQPTYQPPKHPKQNKKSKTGGY